MTDVFLQKEEIRRTEVQDGVPVWAGSGAQSTPQKPHTPRHHDVMMGAGIQKEGKEAVEGKAGEEAPALLRQAPNGVLLCLSFNKVLLCPPFRLECNGMISAHCNPRRPGSKTGFHHVVQVCLKLQPSGDPPTSASQSAVITGVSHSARP
ncbi:hypothetical protein AAY473_030876 [Plecturocebus cupreus]